MSAVLHEEQAKLLAGRYRILSTIRYTDKRIEFDFPYNAELKDEIKAMEGHKYHGFDEINPRKIWSVAKTPRNLFQLEYMKGGNPYARYDCELPKIELEPRFHTIRQKHYTPFAHQPVMVSHMLTRKGCVVAGEMGTSKTLAAIYAMERTDVEDWYYVAPRSALMAVQREFRIWGAKHTPEWMTYEGLTKMMKEWDSGTKPRRGVIFDESSKIKSPTSQRSLAAKALADGMRLDYGADNCYVWLLSGSPAPKAPTDWYWQAEVACPGFLKEGDYHKFERRLSLIVQKDNAITGGSYPQKVCWYDDERRCRICGQFQESEQHDEDMMATMDRREEYHGFTPSVNEVVQLYERLKGLVIIYFKKDCLDLPEKNYRIIEVKPTQATLRAAKLLTTTSKTVIQGLTRLRELSDGFQYKEVPRGTEKCPRCHGTKKALDYREVPGTCPECKSDDPATQRICVEAGTHAPQMDKLEVECPNCDENGEVQAYDRETQEVPCPKDQALKDLLDEYEDVGRVVIYAGFTGSIDRCVRVCKQEGWAVIRVDQGSWRMIDSEGNPVTGEDYISVFQDKLTEYPRVAFVAHPGSAGMGLTLTASPVIIYYSNDFNAEYRIQSEDRIHRTGMDVNRGATIVDIFHLPTDQKVFDNLKRKRDLQSMTLGEFKDALDDSATLERKT